MRLSETAEFAALTRRDGVFESLGFVTHDTPKMLVFIESPRFAEVLGERTNVSCVISTEELAPAIPSHLGLACTPHPRRSFFELHNRLARETSFYGAPFDNEIAPSARVHETAFVAKRGVRIGERVVVDPLAVILEGSIIGDDSIIRSGSVVGSDGFEFKALGDELLPVAHAGCARLGSRVEIQSNTCVDRAVFGGFTDIGDDTKVDKLALIGHNVRVGRRCRIAAGAVLAGSAALGDDVWVGPNAIVSNEVRIGTGARVSLGAVVTRDVGPGETVTGNFAVPHARFLDALRRTR